MKIISINILNKFSNGLGFTTAILIHLCHT